MVAGGMSRGEGRLGVLDGWRAISILLVLATHMLPLGPKALRINEASGPMGMSLFFTLSGFLIVRFLIQDTDIASFAIRRIARIVPLSWLAMLLLMAVGSPPVSHYPPNLLFYANLPPIRLLEGGGHLWSIFLEMQFYLGIAMISLLFGQRGLYLVPVICVGITVLRVHASATVSIVTWYRADEILAGGILALIYSGWLGERAKRCLARVSVYPLILLLFAASHPSSGPLQFIRPYFAALTVGATLLSPPAALRRFLQSRSMVYIAEISYALYIVHGVLLATWLGSGATVERYLKRPLLIGATFLLAHLSTFYFEKPIMRLARRVRLKREKVGRLSPE